MRVVVRPTHEAFAAELAWLRVLGAVGEAAANYLAARIDEGKIVVRTFERYLDALRRFAGAQQGMDLESGLAAASIEAYLLTHLGRRPRTLAWTRGVIARLVRHATGRPYCSPLDAEAPPPAPIPTWSRKLDIDEAIRRFVVVVERRIGEETDTAGHHLRLALIYMCRHGGAVAADLTAMTFDDLAPGRRWAGELAETWRALRVGQRRVLPGERDGVAESKERICDLTLPPLTRAALQRWIGRRGQPASGGDCVFVLPGTLQPLDRRDVWRIVSGTIMVTDDVGRPEFRVGEEAEANAEQLSPALLRHCLALELTHHYPSDADFRAIMAERMGILGRGMVHRYRAALGMEKGVYVRARRTGPLPPRGSGQRRRPLV